MALVSVIMNCLNAERYLKEAIDSVYSQTLGDWEIILFDNASTDHSAKIAKSFDSRLKYYMNDITVNLGEARNRAIEKATGKYLALLDCDDLWEPKKLEKQIELFNRKPEVGLVYSDAIYIGEKTKDLSRYFLQRSPYRGQVTRPLIIGNFIPCLTAVVRADQLKQVGSFREELNVAEEYELFLRLSLITNFDYIDEPLAKYRLHERNTSKDIGKMYLEQKRSLEVFRDHVKGRADLLKMIDEQLEIVQTLRIYYRLTVENDNYSKDEIKSEIGKIRNLYLRMIFNVLLMMPKTVNVAIYSVLRSAKKIAKTIKRSINP